MIKKPVKPAPEIEGLRDIDSIGYDDPMCRKKIFEAAEAAGCEVVVCQEDEIQIDLDEPWKLDESYTSIRTTVMALLPRDILPSVFSWVSFGGAEAWKSRHGNTHVVLKLKIQRFSPAEKCVLAVCLGSDPVRENLNLKRIKDGSPNPIALFRPKSSHV